jgi:hypothetical protein
LPGACCAALLHRCQIVLLDQFGVLHDGQQPYPHAIAAVEQLHAAGKHVLVLSNSSRRSGGTIGKLAKMGFKEHWFAGAGCCCKITAELNRPTPSCVTSVRSLFDIDVGQQQCWCVCRGHHKW